MRRLRPLAGLLLLCAPARLGAGEAAPGPARDALRGAVEAALEPAVDPCRDFYRFACGGWLATTRPPAGEGRWSRGFSTRRAAIRATLRELLDEAVRDEEGEDPLARRVGDFHAACLDAERVEARGLAPLTPWLERVDRVRDLAGAFGVAAELGDLGASPFFALAPAADPDDPRTEGLRIAPGGVALPAPELYRSDDRVARRLRAAYRRHVAAMLALTGLGDREARRAARDVVELETELARLAALDAEPASVPLAAAPEAAGLPWGDYFAAAGRSELAGVARIAPRVGTSLERILATPSAATLRAYLRWQAVHAVAPLLPARLVAEDFRFFGRELAGRRDAPSRAEQCTSLTSRSLPDALGALYAERSLSEPARSAAEATVAAVGEALAEHLPDLPWLDEPAARRAAERVRSVGYRVGESDRAAGGLTPPFDRSRLFENVVAARGRERRERIRRVGARFDAAPTLVAPFDVIAYWDPLAEALEVPAGLLAPPFFDPGFPAAMRFGALGALAGHELAHAFDDPAPSAAASAAAGRRRGTDACLSSQIAALEVAAGLRPYGDRVLNESFADAVGLAAAHAAFREAATNRPADAAFVPALTDAQLFFVAWAQSWCTVATPEALALQVREDTHAPARVRATAALLNSRDFRRAFRCEEGDPMAPVPLCTLW